MPISFSGAEPQDLAATIAELEARPTTFARKAEPTETKGFIVGDVWIWYAATGTPLPAFFVFEADRTWHRIGSLPT